MLYAYLASTIIGGVLLLASLVTGGHHGGGGAEHHAENTASNLLSVRLWTYFLAFAGATGLLLTLTGGAGTVLAGVLAAGVGAIAGGTAQLVIRKAGSHQLGGTIRDEELVGKSGQLLLPCGKGQSGKVRLLVKGQMVDLIATTDDPGEIGAREEVLVVEVKEGSAVVARNPIDRGEKS
jgi:membrane protein implicated in regulation of membrane protease activity